MSWQAYVDDQLLLTGKVTHAAILGQQDHGIWAIHKGFTLTDAETAGVISAFEDLNNTQAHGLSIGGERYFTTTAETVRVLGMKGSKGCILVKTTRTIIVGVSEPPLQLPEMSAVVEKLGDYLRGLGY